MVDLRPVLERYGIRCSVFADDTQMDADVALVANDTLNQVVADCLRGRCLVFVMAEAVYAVCEGDLSRREIYLDVAEIVAHCKTDTTVQTNASRARCIALLKEV